MKGLKRSMEPKVAYDLIRLAILERPELRWKNWPNQHPRLTAEYSKTMNPYLGFCFISTQVFCELVKEAVPYSHGRSHFWAQIGDKVWDPTFEQFDYQYEYNQGKPTKFKTFSKRAQELMKTLEAIK